MILITIVEVKNERDISLKVGRIVL